MQKIGDVTNTADGNGEYTNGNVAAGVAPTILDAVWFNTIQREIINVISKAGIKLNKNNDAQLSEAIFQLISNGKIVLTDNLGNSSGLAVSQKLTNQVNDNANTRLEKSKNGADIPDPKRFVENLGLKKTVNQAANAYPKTGGVVDGEVQAEKLFSQSIVGIAGDRHGMQGGSVDAASFNGNNLEILSWHGIGFKSTESGKTNVYVNTRTGDIITQGLIGLIGNRDGIRGTSIDDASFQGNNIEILSWNGIGLKCTKG
ncbi:tail fiber protein, partial [Xenorhabdus bovienii]